MHQVALALDLCVKCTAISKLVLEAVLLLCCCSTSQNLLLWKHQAPTVHRHSISLTTHIQFISVSKTPAQWIWSLLQRGVLVLKAIHSTILNSLDGGVIIRDLSVFFYIGLYPFCFLSFMCSLTVYRSSQPLFT